MFVLLKLRKSFFGAALVAILGFSVLPGCSSTEETPPPAESGSEQKPGHQCADDAPGFDECMEETF